MPQDLTYSWTAKPRKRVRLYQAKYKINGSTFYYRDTDRKKVDERAAVLIKNGVVVVLSMKMVPAMPVHLH